MTVAVLKKGTRKKTMSAQQNETPGMTVRLERAMQAELAKLGSNRNKDKSYVVRAILRQTQAVWAKAVQLQIEQDRAEEDRNQKATYKAEASPWLSAEESK